MKGLVPNYNFVFAKQPYIAIQRNPEVNHLLTHNTLLTLGNLTCNFEIISLDDRLTYCTYFHKGFNLAKLRSFMKIKSSRNGLTLLITDIYPTNKETHHLELFNSQENHK